MQLEIRIPPDWRIVPAGSGALVHFRPRTAQGYSLLDFGSGSGILSIAGAVPYDFIVANILRPVLLDHAKNLTTRLALGGTLILSGWVATDLPELITRYAAELRAQSVIHQRGEWRALVWAPALRS